MLATLRPASVQAASRVAVRSDVRVSVWLPTTCLAARWLVVLVFAVTSAAGCGEPAGTTDARSRPNLLVFVLDAARVDHFGAYGYARETTPHIDAFAVTATRFTRAISDGSFTFASIAALFTGLPPDRTGLLRARRLDADLALLPETARAEGYRSRGYSENPFVTATFGFDRGFESFETTLDHATWKRDKRHFEHSSSGPGIDAMLDFMGEPSERPFFAYLHLLRPHNPYSPPDGFAGRFGSRETGDGSTATLLALDKRGGEVPPERIDNLRALYDENLAAADATFGRLIAGMSSRGVLDRTIVVLLSDHGEAFLEHDRLLHGSTTFDEMIRIPLLIRIPGQGGGVVDQPVQLAQLGERLGEVLSGSRAAVDLIRTGSGATVSWAMQHERRACVRTRARKLIVDPSDLRVVAYYDLESDPGERNPLPPDREAQRLHAEIEARIREGHASLSRLSRRPAAAIDPDVLEQIRALGYREP
jgi:hypothetical protein